MIDSTLFDDAKKLMEDTFGSTDPKRMPGHLFADALFMDYESSIRAEIEKQDYSVCPRHWYVDAEFQCCGCRQNFTWKASEQKVWFEDFGFWVDSSARHCPKCRASRRHLAKLRSEYDSNVASARDHGTFAEKNRIIEIIFELEESLGNLPEKLIGTRELFQKQNAKADVRR